MLLCYIVLLFGHAHAHVFGSFFVLDFLGVNVQMNLVMVVKPCLVALKRQWPGLPRKCKVVIYSPPSPFVWSFNPQWSLLFSFSSISLWCWFYVDVGKCLGPPPTKCKIVMESSSYMSRKVTFLLYFFNIFLNIFINSTSFIIDLLCLFLALT